MITNGPAQPIKGATAAPQPIATVRSYEDLRRVVAEHCEQIGMTRAELDVEAGIADGHAAKLLARRARKKLGFVTLGRVMAAVGLVLLVAIDLDSQSSPQACPPRPPRQHWRDQRGSAWGKRMAARRALALSDERRSEIGRIAARARWQRKKSKPASTASSNNTTRQLSMF
jgi:hypothetical protein